MTAETKGEAARGHKSVPSLKLRVTYHSTDFCCRQDEYGVPEVPRPNVYEGLKASITLAELLLEPECCLVDRIGKHSPGYVLEPLAQVLRVVRDACVDIVGSCLSILVNESRCETLSSRYFGLHTDATWKDVIGKDDR